MLTTKHLEQFAGGDERIIQLADWVEEVLGKGIRSIEFASEDASFRRYFRIVHGNGSHIAMDAPVEYMDIQPFIQKAERLLQIGLNVPEIFAWNRGKGFALITDFGTTTYFDILSHSNADALYGDAIDALVRLQLGTFSDPGFLPAYDSALLNSEMNLFRDWYLPVHREVELSSEVSDVLDSTFEMLTDKALEQPRVWVHLDYHSRNLMQVEHNNPGIIDFQDAVLGPVTYDLMSLLRDCYIVWPKEKLNQWIDLYLEKSKQAGLAFDIDRDQFVEWFDWMGIQRHIKVAGIFSRLFYRDGKAKFLDDIPTVVAYLESVSRKYRQLEPFHKLILKLRD